MVLVVQLLFVVFMHIPHFVQYEPQVVPKWTRLWDGVWPPPDIDDYDYSIDELLEEICYVERLTCASRSLGWPAYCILFQVHVVDRM